MQTWTCKERDTDMESETHSDTIKNRKTETDEGFVMRKRCSPLKIFK